MQKRKRIAFLVGQIDEYYQTDVISGFEKYAFERDYDICVFAMYQKYQSSAAREIGETSIFSMIPYEQFDGVVMMLDTLQTPGLADNLEAIIKEKAKCPVLSVDKLSENFTSVIPNHYTAVKEEIRHLIEDHHYTDIAYLTGKAWHPYSQSRLKAFKDCMAEHGLEVPDNRVFYGDFWYTSGENLGDRLVRSGDKMPQAIACANDCMAIGLAKSLAANGYKIPEDIAVIGYDSTEEGRMSPVPITSVFLPAEEFGRHAAETIDALIEGRETRPFECPVKMFKGNSCGCSSEDAIARKELRSTWDTDISSNSVYSTFNYIDEDLLIQESYENLMETIFAYVYQIREFESFSICLNEDWEHYNIPADKGHLGDQLNKDILEDTDRFFSDKILEAMSCRPEKLNADKINADAYFDRSELLPRLNEDRERPEVFIFSPLYFEDASFGYACISYSEPGAYSEAYRIWLKSIMRGLEYFRRQDNLRCANRKLESGMVRDALTGLYNYRGLTQRSPAILSDFKKSKDIEICVLAVDIKNLAKINSNDGREAGDKAIVRLSEIMKHCYEEGEVFSFGSGEQAGISFISGDVGECMSAKIKQIRDYIAEYNDESGLSKVDIYYGYATGKPADDAELARLVNFALSKKNAQKASLNSVNDDGNDNWQDEAIIVNDILDKNKINYHFQPIVDAHTGEIFAYEALMRVDVTPYINPPVVLKYAESFHRLYDVENATFTNVLNIIDSRARNFKEDAKIFINSIPGQHLKDEDIARLDNIMSKHSKDIVVELTEESELDDRELNQLKDKYARMGVETAIDDYGTGYSNVTNLLRYMPKYVKVDRSLLSEIQNSPQKQHLVKDIITFAHDNDIIVLAEGVETEEELACVIHLGVDLIQGYYTARPAAEVKDQIDAKVKAEIIKYNRLEEELKNKYIFYAGRDARISTSILAQKEYQTIKIVNGQVTYRDVSIVGAPGQVPTMCIDVEDGYSGQITLENVHLSGRKRPAAINIGSGCDVVLVLKGENFLEAGGIKVAPDASLLIEGDGNLQIQVTQSTGFCIGNEADSKHGRIIFQQDGTIDLNLNCAKGIAIGAGLGGDIDILKGKYIFNLSGQECVGIGSVSGDIRPVIKNCSIEMNSTALIFVGIGSVRGKTEIIMEDLAFEGNFTNNEVVCFGTRFAEFTTVTVTRANIIVKMLCSSGAVAGSFVAKDTVIRFNYLAMSVDLSGKSAAIYRGMDKNVSINVTSSHIEGNVKTELKVPEGAKRMDFHVTESSTRLYINGELLREDF
ncbi:MAG: EAL domain-containing protein [Saccharofermentans sp.]|nr:EAL domain-containing protein [Saccharofermentans sp.]